MNAPYNSYSQPQRNATVLNLLISGWYIDMMGLSEGDAVFVRAAALKREAVILLLLMLNQSGDI